MNEPTPGGQAVRILIAEDSPIQAELLRRVLADAGYVVEIANDGVEALAMAEAKRPDLVISDIAMPNMDGFTLCHRLRQSEALADLPIILLTSLTDIWDVIRGLQAGADNYLTKPYDARLLLERIADTLTERRAHDQDHFEVDIQVGGQPVKVSAGPRQLVNLLLSTYRNAIAQNELLQKTQDELMRLNADLEQEVVRKTRDLLEKERSLYAETRKSLESKAEHLRELRDNLMDSVRALAETVELRDPYTAGHQNHVAELALAIAGELGLPEDTIEGLKIAAIVHDIGKIRIPVEILSKPGKLDKEEMELIKLHPEAGYQILKSIHFPWPIAEVVQEHHERSDGSGYPHGLRQDEIHLEARIIAVADVVEAMASHRPYRPALGLDKALEEIRAGRGSRFDPEIVDACIRVLEKGLWKP